MYSPNDNKTLFIYLKDQCNNKDINKIKITFEDCTCLVGFYVDKHNKISCECECDPQITPYKERCNLSSVLISNRGQGWISYDENTGFLFHPFCPYNFCLPPDTVVCVDLNLPNGSDSQCNFNRTGLLCGRCRPGFSASLSSSHCVQCPDINWPWALR